MYVDLEEYLGGCPEPELVNFRVAQQGYPDLKVFREENGRHRLCSSTVDPDFLEVFTDGQQIWVSASKVEKRVRVYRDPPLVSVGIENPKGIGWLVDLGWEDRLRELGFSDEMVKKVADQLNRHQPADYPEDPAEAG